MVLNIFTDFIDDIIDIIESIINLINDFIVNVVGTSMNSILIFVSVLCFAALLFNFFSRRK